MKKLTIAIDFDGTCVTNDYPSIGRSVGAEPILREVAAKGHRLILLTNRSSRELEDAVTWFANNNIPLFAVNNNPEQYLFSDSPKVYANYYLDDTAIGCPLINNPVMSKKPFVDWKAVREIMLSKGIL